MKKKSLFLAALAALTMATSCSQDEQQSVNKGHPISFNAALDVTRVDDVTTKTLENFWVNAINEKSPDTVLFRNLQFSKKSEEDRWVSKDSKFWPEYKVKFYAYAPEAAKNGFTVDKGRIHDFTVNDSVGKQVDLITGSVSGSKQDNAKTGVAKLELSHALSKIVFKAKGKNDQYRCEIQGIGIGNVHDKGSYDIESKQWSITQNNHNYFYHKFEKPIVIDKADSVANLTPRGGFKLIPQTITPWDKKTQKISKGLEATFICMFVVVKEGDKTTFRGFAYIPMPKISWVANKEYVYTIDLSKGLGVRGGIKQPDNPDDTTGPDAPNPDKPVPDKPGPDRPDRPVVLISDPISFVSVTVSDWENTNEEVSGETAAVAANE